MRKLLYKIKQGSSIKFIEFITNRTPRWTEEQYLRHKSNTVMELISNETTEEKKPISREVRLG